MNSKKKSAASRNGGSQHLLDQLLAERRYAEARDVGTKLLALEPRNPAILHKLGVAAIGLDDFEHAIEMLSRAVELAPRDARALNDLGIAHEKFKAFDAAERAYRGAMKLDPKLAEAQSNLADLLVKLERPVEAIELARNATRLSPANPLTWLALGETLLMQGKTEEAIVTLEKATRIHPLQIKVFTLLAEAHGQLKRIDEAIAVLTKARSLLGDDPKILNDLGLLLGTARRYEEAQPLFEAAYEGLKKPAILLNIITNLGYLRRTADQLALADEVLNHPQPNVAVVALFSVAAEHCDWELQERLLPHYLDWYEFETRNIGTAARNLLHLLAVPSVTPKTVRRLMERIVARARGSALHHDFRIEYSKALHSHSSKLRVGYLSGDFKHHVVNFIISGVLSNYDKQYFETYCYSNLEVEAEDEITAQYRRAVDSFIPVSKMGTEELARRITDDGIQVLIDLSGYTAKSRLEVMYYRPAPVQITFLGYPFTTGLKEVDYALSDSWLNGPENATCFSEGILEVPNYCAAINELPVVPENDGPPFRRNGYISFGSLSNCYKLNRPTVAAWSRILSSVPDSRLVLNNPRYEPSLTQKNVIGEFERNGISADRISIITTGHPKGNHLFWYEDLDIALDTFPFTGGTTTNETLWMGVPVITLVGEAHYGRSSYSVLKNCGTEVDDLIAFSIDEYVGRAVTLAHNEERIAELHRVLSENFRQSLACDPTRYIRYFEETLIDGWNRKFPERPKFTADTFSYTRLTSPAAPIVATASHPDDMFRYVLEEQGAWFAPEYGRLQLLARQLDGIAIEIGAEPGFFSLELAHSGMHAISLSTSTVAGRQIRAAAEKGGVADRVDVRLESARTRQLDRADAENVALLRIGVEANDGAAGPIVRNPDFWKANAPVVLASVHFEDRVDISTVEALAAMGYGIYRFLPGLGCFVPHSFEEALDPYVLYLLACPPEREARLIAAGVLVRTPIFPEESVAFESPDSSVKDPWQEIDNWVIRCATSAHDSNRNAAERLGYHHAALQAQLAVVQAAPSTTRLISLARLLADAGRRTEAASLLHQALAAFENGTALLTLPFLAPSSTWDGIPPGDRMAEWLLAAVLEARCRAAAHSTYFLSDEDFASLDTIVSLGFSTDFIEGAKRARDARHQFLSQA